MPATAHINLTSILQKVVVASSKDSRLENLAYGSALSRVNFHKNQLIRDFDDHPITREIEAGPDADSQFLDRGNLFSFIGFVAGNDPIGPIRAVLQDRIKVRRMPKQKIIRKNSVLTKFIVETPFLKDIYRVTPYPDSWKSGSWVDDLENRGISHFEFYVFSFAFKGVPQSRSGTGLQRKTSIGGSPPGPIPYIRELLEGFGDLFD